MHRLGAQGKTYALLWRSLSLLGGVWPCIGWVFSYGMRFAKSSLVQHLAEIFALT